MVIRFRSILCNKFNVYILAFTDEGFVTHLCFCSHFYSSSGILDDSESDTLLEGKSRGDSVGSPPPTPTSGQAPEIRVESLTGHRDDYLTQGNRSSR